MCGADVDGGHDTGDGGGSERVDIDDVARWRGDGSDGASPASSNDDVVVDGAPTPKSVRNDDAERW